ncbi:MAG: isoleucine--tRNA ligase, partial [Sphingomonadales bacterium]|nr:isoleucine--tRNA ligase [Sphingomonadales bacterium]
SITVAFALADDARERLEMEPGDEAAALIWTTTPWTLPANLATALHPGYEYALVRANGRLWIVAAELVETTASAAGWVDTETVKIFKGGVLEGSHYINPLTGREGLFILAPYVTLEQGTGLVHTAPGHGADDFHIGAAYGLEPYAPLDDGGRFTDEVEEWAGLHVHKANGPITERLRELEVLVSHQEVSHSYPHCWRCKKPVIFRATEQWFISMDHEKLREKSIEEVEKVQWVPAWGKERIQGMIKNRPDWCISRQRTWGVPITLFVHKETGELHPNTKDLIETIAQRIETESIDAWFEHDASEFIGDDAENYEKATDTLDVWFDSGVTHACVLGQRDSLPFPADLYLEGSDQHRGWFHSSLLESCGTRGRAPYDTILTHGFILDEKAEKMSKSSGNALSPNDVYSQFGADILRLWVVGTDYTEDPVFGPETLKQMSDIYRRLRNTLRFLLGNLDGFDEAEHIDIAQMPELERWMLGRLHKMDAMVRTSCDAYNFHPLFNELSNFCTVDLSAFYFDIRKDTLYCERSDSTVRRATRTVLNEIFNYLTAWLAPFICFTAEEAWQTRFPSDTDSIHYRLFPDVPEN